MTTTLNVTDNAICNATTFTDEKSLITKEYLINLLNDFHLIGEIIMYAGTTLPTGWLFCDGQTLDASANPQYEALYNVIGQHYGGNLPGVFKLPNLSQTMPIGSNSMSLRHINYQGSNNVVSGGNKTMTTNQLPYHSHDMSHSHSYNWHYRFVNVPNKNDNIEGLGSTHRIVNIPNANVAANKNSDTSDTSGSSGNAGGSTEILPPFCVINFIIYYGI